MCHILCIYIHLENLIEQKVNQLLKFINFYIRNLSSVFKSESLNFCWLSYVGGVPVIISPPQNQTVVILSGDESVTYKCFAEGEGLSYSWERQGSRLPLNATAHTLMISGVREEDSGNYRCIVENRFGQVTSDYASLNVTGKTIGICTMQS